MDPDGMSVAIEAAAADCEVDVADCEADVADCETDVADCEASGVCDGFTLGAGGG
jgi:hypothetical protein